MNKDIPQHIPVQTAIAPEKKPYQQTHVIHTPHPQEEQENRTGQHSLSPEKLGVVGYVKDVAGFVKDVVHERQEKKNKEKRRSSLAHEEQEQQHEHEQQHEQEQYKEIKQRQERQQSPLAEVVTGLFPIDHGCIHADELRQQMMKERKLL